MSKPLPLPYREVSSDLNLSLVRSMVVDDLAASKFEVDGYHPTNWKLFRFRADKDDFLIASALRDSSTNLTYLCFLHLTVSAREAATIVRFQFRLPDVLPQSVSDLVQIGTEDYIVRLLH